MTRRDAIGAILGAFALDPERALWVPGKKTVSLPTYPKVYMVQYGGHFRVGDFALTPLREKCILAQVVSIPADIQMNWMVTWSRPERFTPGMLKTCVPLYRSAAHSIVESLSPSRSLMSHFHIECNPGVDLYGTTA